MARRKTENTHTTISIKWDSKERFRKYARLVKETRNGQMHESDAVVFDKLLRYYECIQLCKAVRVGRDPPALFAW